MRKEEVYDIYLSEEICNFCVKRKIIFKHTQKAIKPLQWYGETALLTKFRYLLKQFLWLCAILLSPHASSAKQAVKRQFAFSKSTSKTILLKTKAKTHISYIFLLLLQSHKYASSSF